MSAETETGTIKDTVLYQELYKYVIKKFGWMSNLSMHLIKGNRTSLLGINNTANNDKGRTKIWWLHLQARKIKYDKSKVFISEAERLAIETKVVSRCKLQGVTKVKFFQDIHFELGKYRRIVSELNPYKNAAYYKLINIK